MECIDTGSHDPAFNLALEEYFLKGKDIGDDIFILWQSKPAVIIGRFQNIWEETNLTFLEEQQIQLLRRISGGGTVYQDIGNICFSYILRNIKPEEFDKSAYIQPVVNILTHMGFQVEISKRNDLSIDGKKFSGNAMAFHKNRLLFHGTILYDSDLDKLEKSLKIPEYSVVSRGVKSIRNSVTNIKHFSPTPSRTIDEFKDLFINLQFLGKTYHQYIPTIEDISSIQNLVETKYSTWDWNYGNNPSFEISRNSRIHGKDLHLSLIVEKGLITSCEFSGEFFNKIESEKFSKSLLNVRFTYNCVLKGLENVNKSGKIPPNQISLVAQAIIGI